MEDACPKQTWSVGQRGGEEIKSASVGYTCSIVKPGVKDLLDCEEHKGSRLSLARDADHSHSWQSRISKD